MYAETEKCVPGREHNALDPEKQLIRVMSNALPFSLSVQGSQKNFSFFSSIIWAISSVMSTHAP